MKKGILVVAAMVFLGSYGAAWGAEWVTFSVGDDTVAFYDKDSVISLSKGIKKVWTKMVPLNEEKRQKKIAELKAIEPSKNWETYAYTLYLQELNCTASELKLLQVTHYGSQSVLRSVTFDPRTQVSWDPIVPDSVGDDLRKAVCDQPKKREK